MEVVNRTRLTLAIYETLLKAMKTPCWTEQKTQHVIAASAEGYPFPANLDFDQPVGGAWPQTQADLMAEAVAKQWPFERLAREVEAQARQKYAKL